MPAGVLQGFCIPVVHRSMRMRIVQVAPLCMCQAAPLCGRGGGATDGNQYSCFIILCPVTAFLTFTGRCVQRLKPLPTSVHVAHA